MPFTDADSMVIFNATTDKEAPSCVKGLDNGTYVVTAVEIDRRGTIGTHKIIKTIKKSTQLLL